MSEIKSEEEEEESVSPSLVSDEDSNPVVFQSYLPVKQKSHKVNESLFSLQI